MFYKTRTGTPQGRIISPLLANIALHGMEEALNIKYIKVKSKDRHYYNSSKSKYIVVRYADDFVVLCMTLEDAQAVYSLLEDYLKERGLTLAPDKTKITNLYDGFDFLGYNIRCYKGQDKHKVLIKASKDSINDFKSTVKEIISSCYPWNIEKSINTLNNKINGKGDYWSKGSNRRLFSKMDSYIYELWMKRLKRWYPNKPTKWRVNKHFKTSTREGYNWKWIFTDPISGTQVDKMAWIGINYPQCIKYKATPYDKEYEEYIKKHTHQDSFQCLYGK